MDSVLTYVNRSVLESFDRHMKNQTESLNDNQMPSRTELEAANRDLRASLKACEELVSDCREKLAAAYGLVRPPESEASQV